MVMAFALAWVFMWNSLEFVDYDWTYSDNTLMKALQYCLHFLWGCTYVLSVPAWFLIVFKSGEKYFNIPN